MNYQEQVLRRDPLHRPVRRTTCSANKTLCQEVRQGTKTLIWPGIDIDIPTQANKTKCTRQGTRDAVVAAFHGGAHGVILSRKYSEMKLANLSGAGEAIKQLL